MEQSQDIESATTAVQTDGRPDQKTRRYDRQLRLWAATGQAALEESRILVLSASATSTSILKNLVLPGIGHFTILDPETVSPEDAGNNFFFEGPSSIGKSRAEEAVRLLAELNDGVQGTANTSSLADILEKDPSYLTSFSLVIAHNLETGLLERLSKLLWDAPSRPILFTVDSAGFVAEFSIQFHEQDIIESHAENSPSLRIDKPFPALLEHARSLDFDNMDSTDHAHIPYVVILVRALDDWKKTHNGQPPQTSEEKSQFKAGVLSMGHKYDEENFEEAEAQAYRCWPPKALTIPPDVNEIFSDTSLEPGTQFHSLVRALEKFVQKNGVLPLTSTLPDMKASTETYIDLQRMYKDQAQAERDEFRAILHESSGGEKIADDVVDLFVKNAHAIRVLKGKPWALGGDPAKLAEALMVFPNEASTHLALVAQRVLKATGVKPNVEALTAEARAFLPAGAELSEEAWKNAAGEIARAPTADLPNVAAFLGGLVAQEVIKMITKQYIPIAGTCVIDLIDTWTGTLLI